MNIVNAIHRLLANQLQAFVAVRVAQTFGGWYVADLPDDDQFT
jgi:hypothetical protein